MFSFHRPKVYRSPTGCCICKAKSSSSRFTDSKRYEEDFMECFKLSTPRQGEICNACVLLVKRWKKLPVGSDRNWGHVVDARAGPGMKSLTKFKSKNKKNDIKIKTIERERELSPPLSDKSENDDTELAEVDFYGEDVPSAGSSRTASPGTSDSDGSAKSRRKQKRPTKRKPGEPLDVIEFIDSDYWTKTFTCCGPVWQGQNNEIIYDNRYHKPCAARLAKIKAEETVKLSENYTRNTNDNTGNEATSPGGSVGSLDSGFDDLSNPDGSIKQVAEEQVTELKKSTAEEFTVTENVAITEEVTYKKKINSQNPSIN